MNITKTVSLDLRKNTHKIIDVFKTWDRNSRTIEFEIVQDGEQVEIPDTCKAIVAMTKPDGKPVFNNCEIVNGIIRVKFTEQMLVPSGIAQGEIRIYDSSFTLHEGENNESNGTLLISSTFLARINKSAVDDLLIQSSHEYNALTNIILNNQNVIKATEKAIEDATNATTAIQQVNSNMTNAENARVQAENARVESENARISAESERVNAESNRVLEENTRQSNEISRQNTLNNKISEVDDAIERSNNATENANNAAAAAWAVANDDISSKTITFSPGEGFNIPQSGDTIGNITGKMVGNINNLDARISETIESMGSGVFVDNDEIGNPQTFNTQLDADTLGGHPSSDFATANDVGNISELNTENKNSVVAAINEVKSQIFDLVYPIGSIYISTQNTNPSTIFGGTWVAWGNGKVPVGVNTDDTDFNSSEKTGGSKTVSLNSNNLPSHNHSVNSINIASSGSHTHSTTAKTVQDALKISDSIMGWAPNQRSGGENSSITAINVTDARSFYIDIPSLSIPSSGGHTHSVPSHNTNSAGSGEAFSNLPPYITCYMWKRTA